MTIPVGRLRNLAGTGALIAGSATFAALTAAVIWKIGAARSETGLVCERPAFLPGVLPLAGPLSLLSGASVTAFEEVGMGRVIAGADPPNAASLRVLEKLGMKPIGNANPKVPDEPYYALYRKDSVLQNSSGR